LTDLGSNINKKPTYYAMLSILQPHIRRPELSPEACPGNCASPKNHSSLMIQETDTDLLFILNKSTILYNFNFCALPEVPGDSVDAQL
jgi:hypothetical protein